MSGPARAAPGSVPLRDVLGAATDALRAAGCESARLDAEVIAADALGVERGTLYAHPDLAVPPAAARLMAERVRRRVRREPVAYVIGRKGFRGIELAVDRRVLVPRPDSELLVEVASALAPRGARVHDVGTGSGAIALALKHERPDLVVGGSDASAAAVEVARENARRLGLDVALAHASGLPPGRYDLVVANLPYVTEAEWGGLEPEVHWEPREALVGGADGLDAIRSLVAEAPAGTLLALEHGPSQGEAVRALLRDARGHRDLGGRDRVSVGRAP